MLLISTTFAYLFATTSEKRNVFVPGVVDCDVVEEFDGTNKTSIKIQNTGNTSAYIRVNLISYYQNADGEVIAKTAYVPEFTLADGWVHGSDGYYYYRYPIAPDALTDEMLGSSIVVTKDDNNSQVIEVMAEAIQADPHDAVIDSWTSAAGVQGDDSLLIEVKTLADHAIGAKVRVGNYITTLDSQEINYKVYTQYPFLVDKTTTASGIENGIFLKAADSPSQDNSFDVYINLQKNVNVTKVILHLTDTFGAITQTKVYVSTTESGMDRSHISVSNVDGRMKVATFDEEANGSFVHANLTLGSGKSVYLTEIEVWGYQIDQNHALTAEYKGSSNMVDVSVPDGLGGVSTTKESMTNYHSGVLNDGTISTNGSNSDSANKMEFKSNTTGDVSVIFKLESAQVINKVITFAGTTNPAQANEKLPDKITVYVGHGENISDCAKLGECVPSSMEDYQGTVTLRRCTVEGENLSGQYVIVVFSGIDVAETTTFGVNEIQIWSDVSVISWE